MFSLTIDRLLYTIPAIVIALTFHEYAHARVAYHYGDPTAKNAGRLTLNPLKHLDLVGFLSLLFLGFGWAKAVPVNPWYFQGDRKKKMLMVSLAGPLTNLLEAVAATLVLGVFNYFIRSGALALNTVVYYLLIFIQYFMQINVILAVFNLLPIPPLDGSKILAGLLPDKAAGVIYKIENFGWGILLILIFLPELLSLIGLPYIDILGTIIGIPAQWILDLLYKMIGM